MDVWEWFDAEGNGGKRVVDLDFDGRADAAAPAPTAAPAAKAAPAPPPRK